MGPISCRRLHGTAVLREGFATGADGKRHASRANGELPLHLARENPAASLGYSINIAVFAEGREPCH
jgi:hypothetical protein